MAFLPVDTQMAGLDVGVGTMTLGAIIPPILIAFLLIGG